MIVTDDLVRNNISVTDGTKKLGRKLLKKSVVKIENLFQTVSLTKHLSLRPVKLHVYWV